MASLAKAARKLKRTGKSAAQFKFTSTFEYMELSCNGFWRPERLKVIWLRNHRRVESITIPWVLSEDRGPNGADGKATFNPAISVSLIVTLYRAPKKTNFEEKEYKFYIESEGPGGKKILASFNCDMAEYAAVPSAKEALDMTFKCVSKKVNKAVLGITLESQFIKEGNSQDDDMQSTFSAISIGQDSLLDIEDEEEEDDDVQGSSEQQNGGATVNGNGVGPHSSESGVKETSTSDPVVENSEKDSLVVLGTGATLKRGTLPVEAPTKPPRTGSFKRHHTITQDQSESKSAEVNASNGHMANELNSKTGVVATATESAATPTVEGDKEGEKGDNLPEIQVTNSMSSGQSMENSSPVVHEANQNVENPSPVVSKPEGNVDGGTRESVENSLPVEPQNDKPVDNLPSDESHAREKMERHEESQKVDDKMVAKEQPEPASTTAEGSTERNFTSDKIVKSDSNSSPQETKLQSDTSAEEERSIRKSSFGMSSGYRAEDSLFETAQLLAGADQSRASISHPVAKPRRKIIESNEVYKAPPNPYLEEEDETAEATPPPVSPTLEWLGDVPIIDCFNETVPRSKVDNADLIGLYFSASWCPPCRRFLPKLIYFYHQLKQHNKSFEIIYLSSDYSKPDMLKYMVEQQMPWVAMEYGSQIVETLKARFKVKAIPLLTIVSTKGDKIEESGKKSVEGANTAAAAIKLYNKWQKLLAPENEHETGSDSVGGDGETKERKGILSKVKNHIRGKGKNESTETEPEGFSQKSVDDHIETERTSVEEKKSTKTRGSKSSTSELLEEKEERIHHLEAVNMTLKQTNDDLNEEVTELRSQMNEQAEKIKMLESTHQRMEDERRTLAANMNIRGWLFKRGIKGPTANFWRRRYFRCDQGSRICYYKSSAEGTPQGYIDLDKVISVQEVSAAQQDKNHATFLVQCDGRTFQLQGHDEATMRKWMSAIEFLKNYRQRGGASVTDDIL